MISYKIYFGALIRSQVRAVLLNGLVDIYNDIVPVLVNISSLLGFVINDEGQCKLPGSECDRICPRQNACVAKMIKP